MLVKLRGNIGDTLVYCLGDRKITKSRILYVDLTVFEDSYDVTYILENGEKVKPNQILDIENRPVKDLEVMNTVE